MSVPSIADYLTKKEIEEQFHRSHRSLTRDFSQAVRVGDSDILPNLKLRTEDGKEIIGTEVTLEMIQELSNQGLSPTWYAKQEWVQEHYDKETSKKKKPSGKEVKPTEEVSPNSTSSSSDLVTTLKQQVTRLEMENDRRVNEHQKDKESFMEQIKMYKDMFDTLKDDHTDTKSLLKEVHQVMGKFADFSLLGSAPEPVKEHTGNNEKTPEKENIVNVNPDSPVEAVIVEEPMKPKGKTSQKKRKNKAKVKTTTNQKSKQSKTKVKAHKWYETPTLNKFLSRK